MCVCQGVGLWTGASRQGPSVAAAVLPPRRAVFRSAPCACMRARAYMLSAVSQRARRGPVYLVFITKPFTEAPIRIKPLSAHTDHRTQPARVCVRACVRV